MKRVKAACICQTLHFMLKEDVGHDYAVKQVKEEVSQYKNTLGRKSTQYKIVEKTEQTKKACSQWRKSSIAVAARFFVIRKGGEIQWKLQINF